MASAKTEAIGRAVPYLFLACVAALSALSAYQLQHWDTDIFWALKSGELIVKNMSVPATDPFSYTFAGKQWVDFTWGFQVIVYLVFNYLGGWSGLFVLQAIVTGGALFFVLLTVRIYAPGRPWLSSFLVLLVFLASQSRFFIRPHLAEFFFISLYAYILASYGASGKIRLLLLLLPLQVIWINIHSSAVLGVFLVGAHAAGAAIDEARLGGFKPGLKFSPSALRLFIFSAALPVVSLINPYGFKLVIFPFLHQGGENAEALRHIAEWTKTPLNELFFYVYPFPIDHFAFVIVALGSVTALISNRKALKARDLIIFATAVYMAGTHVRWNTLFAYFCAPVIASNISGRFERIDGSALVKWTVAALSAFFIAVVVYDYSGTGWREYAGLGLKKGVYPEGTVSFMKKERLTGNIFNEYVYGGYLIYYYPELKVFIDGRTPTVYSPYFFWTTRFEDDDAMWPRMVSEYGINIALIRLSGKSCERLIKDKSWSAVNFDDVAAVFLKKEERFKDVISKWGLKELNPCGEAGKYKAPKDSFAMLKKVRDELKGVISLESAVPGLFVSRTHKLLGLVNTELAALEVATHPGANPLQGEKYLLDAVAEFKKSLEAKRDPSTYYDLGLALGKLKRHDEAFASFKAAVKLNKKHADAYLGAGLMYYDLKDYGNAIAWLKDYVDTAGDASDHLAYKSLGMAYFKTSKYASAAVYLKKAAFTTEDKKELGYIYYHLGNALFETGEYGDGSIYYNRAIEADKDYRRVLHNLALQLTAAGKKESARELNKLLGKV